MLNISWERSLIGDSYNFLHVQKNQIYIKSYRIAGDSQSMTFGNRYNRHEIIIFVLDAFLNENICDLWFFSLSRFVAFWPWNLCTEITLKAKRNHKAPDKLCREMVVIRDIWGHSSLKLSSYCSGGRLEQVRSSFQNYCYPIIELLWISLLPKKKQVS